MKIDKKDLKEIKKIVEDYNELNTEFEKTQKELEAIKEKKDELLRRLEIVHNDELKFYENLKNKYGEGKLDLNSLEYIKN